MITQMGLWIHLILPTQAPMVHLKSFVKLLVLFPLVDYNMFTISGIRDSQEEGENVTTL